MGLDDPYAVIARLLRTRRVNGILDAGASNGRVARRLLRSFPQALAYAFEPNPAYRPILDRAAKSEPRLRPQFSALSDTEGKVELKITRSAGSSSVFAPAVHLRRFDPEGSQVASTELVPAVTIDDWAKRHGNPLIEVLKLDIQGAELRALRGGKRLLARSALLVYTEVLFNPLYEGGALYSDVDLELRRSGFVVYDVYRPRYAENRLLLWANAIFVHAERLGL